MPRFKVTVKVWLWNEKYSNASVQAEMGSRARVKNAFPCVFSF